MTLASRPTRRARQQGAAARTGWIDPSGLARLRPSPRGWIGLCVFLVVGGAFLYHQTSGTTFWSDEWLWAQYRRGNDLGTFLRPYNEHLSLVPIVIYRLLFATAGLRSYVPYRVLVIAMHLVCVAVVFIYASRRVGNLPSLLAAALLLLLGPAYQDILWPFQVAWLISLAAGVGALIMLDRDDRAGDVAACVMLILSLASSSVGLPIALGGIVEVLWGRRRWRDAWVVAVPLALYGLWWLTYQESTPVSPIRVVPGYVVDAAAGVISAVLGLGQLASSDAGTALAWGRPLAIVAVVLLVWRLMRLGRIPPRILTLITILLSFWTLTALSRGSFSLPYESRYLYVGCLFVVLLVVELARGIALRWQAGALLGIAAAAVVVSNIGALRDGAAYLRGQAQLTTADLGAMDAARPILKHSYVATHFPGYPIITVVAGPYFAAERAIGSPAQKPSVLAADSALVRPTADAELIRIHQITLQPSHTGVLLAPAPTVDSVVGGIVTTSVQGPHGETCVNFRPTDFTAAGVTGELQVTVPAAGVLVRAIQGSVAISVRRFGDVFQPLGTLAASSAPSVLRIGPDLATQLWHVRLVPAARATVCALR
jgi:hypothetical protein